VRRIEVVEAVVVKPIEHAPPDDFPGHPKQGADERRPDRRIAADEGRNAI
jgi:hypothetical protein